MANKPLLHPAADLNCSCVIKGISLYATRDAMCGMSVEGLQEKYGKKEIADFIEELNNLISVLEQSMEQIAMMEGQHATKN